VGHRDGAVVLGGDIGPRAIIAELGEAWSAAHGQVRDHGIGAGVDDGNVMVFLGRNVDPATVRAERNALRFPAHLHLHQVLAGGRIHDYSLTRVLAGTVELGAVSTDRQLLRI
jgi:hypothetical protein